MTASGSGWRLAAAAGFCVFALAFFSFTVDDSYIAFRYARNLAAGLGPVFDGQAPREAYSSPLWVVLSSLPFLARLSDSHAVAALKLAGIAFGALTVFLTGALAHRQAGGATGAALASVLIAVMPWMAFWSAGGLETPLYTALLVAALVRQADEEQRGSGPYGSAVAFALLALTRPEGILVALCAILAGPARLRLRSAAIVSGVALALETWRHAYYGALLPTTFAAKAALSRHAFEARAVELLPFFLYVTPLVLAVWLTRDRVRPSRPVLAATLAQAFFLFVPRLEGTPWFRYEVPLLPLLAAIAGAGLAALASRAGRMARVRLAVAALAAALVLPIFWLRDPARYAPSRAEMALASWLRTYQPEARLALYDVGAVPYFSRVPFVFDSNPLGPLSPSLGRPYDPLAMLDWAPDWTILPPDDAAPADPLSHLAADPRFAAAYTRMFVVDAGGGYTFTVWKRNGVNVTREALHAAEAAGLYQSRGSRSTGGSPKYS